VKTIVRDRDFALYQGDCRELAAGLPSNSVDCVVTSPPYYGLRDYGTGTWHGGSEECSHRSARKKTRFDYSLATSPKQAGREGADASTGMWSGECPDCGALRSDNQVGMERSPEEYLNNLVSLFGTIRQTGLANSATVWVNLGDSYDKGRLRGLPWKFALLMVEDGWRLVRDVIWYKRDAVPESVKTRPTTNHEYIFMFTTSKDHYYDWYAVRQDSANVEKGWGTEKRLLRSVWDIPTEVYTEAHFATFPKSLPEMCITAGCPQRVCLVCGEPQRRIVESRSIERMDLPRSHPQWRPRRYDNGKAGDPQSPGAGQRYSEAEHLGWSKCDCNGGFRRGTVLDPFLGSGTTAIVARELNRNAIGYELNEEYCGIIQRRTSQLNLVSEQEVIL